MNIISVNGLSKAFQEKKLFEKITFGVDRGEKIALIGVNGTGKSTLLKILAGKEIPDEGNVVMDRSITVSFLPQTPQFAPEDTVIEHVFSGATPAVAAIKAYEAAVAALEHTNDEAAHEALAHAIEEVERYGAWDHEHRIKAILDELGITDLSLKMGTLSGGMAKKVAIAEALIADADVLMLDEPTNHLDVDTILWLEDYLVNLSKTIIMVSHDRYFLDAIANGIIELWRGGIYRYNGNYSYYLEKKGELEQSIMREDERVASVLRRELDWLKRGPRARTTKQKAHIDRAHKIMEHEFYEADATVDIALAASRQGGKIVDCINLSKSYNGRTIVKKFSHKFRKRERVGIVGGNGSGKTTLLNLISGRLAPDSGESDIGLNTRFGYFDQTNRALNDDMRILQFIRESGEYVTLTDGEKVGVSEMLTRFLFPSSQHYSRIAELSGGEKRRLNLLAVLMSSPNFLIFDEPTNDLDIKTLSILEDFLQTFDGNLIVVSHDRYFMDRVVDELFIFDVEGDIIRYNGSYTEYLAESRQQRADERRELHAKERKSAKVAEKERERKGLTFNEQREMKQLEEKIAKLEKEKVEIEAAFAAPDITREALAEKTTRHTVVEKAIAKETAKWEKLAERA
ncbi:MAG: ABC-F family ATP-binding cassette domain-containing protein [Spirochaetes bacterium]|nr:ABC-F family ATP-binding cassette domain-containing protein [Spirochaetota bacterium]